MDEMQEYVERSEGQRGEDPPVTGVASRQVEPGREEEFEEWVSGILDAVKGFPGYLGSDVLRPKSAEEGEYRILYRFDRTSNLERWEASDERRRWLDKAEPLVQEQKVGRLTGSAAGRLPQPFEVAERLVHPDHVPVLRVNVVEVSLVGGGVAVADGLAGDDGPEAVLEGVDGGGADAARGRGAGDDERVHGGGREKGAQGCAEEAGGEELVEDGLGLPRGYARVDLGPAGASFEGEQRRHLVNERGGGQPVALLVGDGGEDDRDGGRARGVE